MWIWGWVPRGLQVLAVLLCIVLAVTLLYTATESGDETAAFVGLGFLCAGTITLAATRFLEEASDAPFPLQLAGSATVGVGLGAGGLLTAAVALGVVVAAITAGAMIALVVALIAALFNG